MPDRPVAIFDGRCSFCRIWVEYWKRLTGDAVSFTASEDAGDRIQLTQPDGQVLAGAHAVFEILGYSPDHRWMLWLYLHLPGFPAATEALYRFISAHRDAGYRWTRILFGTSIQPASYERVAGLFARVLGFVYFIAFGSCGLQVLGLIGARGILPAARNLPAVRQSLGASAYWSVPTLFWLNSSDGPLQFVCVAGAVVSVVIMLGFAQRICFAAAFLLYLSICSAGQDFLSFQWDMLLLETGFATIFLAPRRTIVWIYRLILFRLMFLSGAVKLLSHDPSWRNLDALSFHYWTQPLPTPLAWYANQLPAWCQRLSTAGVFGIELGLPFLIFLPRRFRWAAAAGFLCLQVFISLTGNYTFFNLLAICLCLFLLDDAALPGFIPKFRSTTRLAIPLLVVLGSLGVFQILNTVAAVPGPVDSLLRFIAPFGIVNSYGLFAVMTTSRPEIVVQGSNDGAIWLDYEFKYKPGDVDRPPPWVAPYQPRLDWQMWFAALSNWRNNPWFISFLARLLEGSPDVLNLLEKNPFPPAQPPRYVRALVYAYRFTDANTRRKTGAWWTREEQGAYLRAISLDDFRQAH
jgi:predicted DCC family thiol-disulfide oxidoreductase YuxK